MNSERHVSWLPAMVAGAAAFVVYSLTVSTSVGFHDSAELALRASQLGATHAPGAPLHTLLGYLLNLAFGDPAAATAWLTVGSATVLTMLLSRLLSQCGIDPVVAAFGGIAFALNYVVWGNAVTTELYALSALLIAVATLGMLRWTRSGSAGFPAVVALAYGLALGAHFANIILLPAFLVPFVMRSGWRDRGADQFLLLSVGAIGIVAIANVVLAANVPPFSQYSPDSFGGLFRYMAGAEHDPLNQQAYANLSSGLATSLARVTEHALVFARHYLFVGVLFALPGLYRLARINLPFAVFTGLVFGAYMGYFTLFGSGDYFLMVIPAYFVFSAWFILGVADFFRIFMPQLHPRFAALLPALFAAIAVSSQFEFRRHEAISNAATAYADDAFQALPGDALAIARWNEFTPLNYLQYIEGRRPDLDFVVPARTVRHYPHGDVADYFELVAESICTRPVVTNKITDELEAAYTIVVLEQTDNWKQLLPSDPDVCGESRE